MPVHPNIKELRQKLVNAPDTGVFAVESDRKKHC